MYNVEGHLVIFGKENQRQGFDPRHFLKDRVEIETPESCAFLPVCVYDTL